MKAYELHPKEGFDALTLTERPSPELGPHDVRVRVRATSLNYRDLVIARGAVRSLKRVVPVSDGAGEVVAVGSAVTRHAVGDRVAAAFFPTWTGGDLSDHHHANALGGSIDGMLAEEVVLGEHAWVRLPAHLSFEEGAALPCAGVTAYRALFEAASLRPGDKVLVQGTGGVSILALQLAKAAGAEVVLTTSSTAKGERAKSLGASHIIDYRTTPAWGQAVRDWSGGRGVDIGVEVGGAGTFDQTVIALRYGGTMSILGILAGVKGEINTHAIFHKTLKVHGVYVGSIPMFEGLNRALATNSIHPVVDRVFSFDEARAAYDYLASASHFGKVVIRVD